MYSMNLNSNHTFKLCSFNRKRVICTIALWQYYSFVLDSVWKLMKVPVYFSFQFFLCYLWVPLHILVSFIGLIILFNQFSTFVCLFVYLFIYLFFNFYTFNKKSLIQLNKLFSNRPSYIVGLGIGNCSRGNYNVYIPNDLKWAECAKVRTNF